MMETAHAPPASFRQRPVKKVNSTGQAEHKNTRTRAKARGSRSHVHRQPHSQQSTQRVAPTGKATDHQYVRPISGHLLWSLMGETGAGLVAMGTAAVVLWIMNDQGAWWLELTAILALIRLGEHLLSGRIPALDRMESRFGIVVMLKAELLISVAFLAACYVMAWPLAIETAGLILAANLVAQTVHVLGSQKLARLIAKNRRTQTTAVQARHRVIILGTGEKARRVADLILDSPQLDTEVIGFVDDSRTDLWRYRDIPHLGSLEQLPTFVGGDQIDAALVGMEMEQLSQLRKHFAEIRRMGLPVCVLPHMYGQTAHCRVTRLAGQPCFVVGTTAAGRAATLLKSLVDRLGALVGLCLSAPIMLLCAVMVKLESRGPIFFKQIRSGRNGRPFVLYKFRTMCSDAEKKKRELLTKNEMSGPVFKIRRDPRVTKIGRILRKYSLDELPQFMNVLLGDMALVGPRPPLPSEVAKYEPWQRRKLAVKPGLTCLWQINGRNAVDFEEWMELDLKYIDNWSLTQDARILLKTLPAVLRGTGM